MKAWQITYRLRVWCNEREMSINLSHTKVWHRRSVALTSSAHGIDHGVSAGSKGINLKVFFSYSGFQLPIALTFSARHLATKSRVTLFPAWWQLSVCRCSNIQHFNNIWSRIGSAGVELTVFWKHTALLPGVRDSSTSTFQPAEGENHLALKVQAAALPSELVHPHTPSN